MGANYSAAGMETFNSGMSLLNSGISAFGQYEQGRMQRSFLELKARQEQFQAKQYEIQGEQQSNILRTQLLNNLASVNAAFGARGVDVGSRSTQNLTTQNILNTESDIQSIKEGAQLKSIGMEGQAGVSRAAGQSAFVQGQTNAARQLFGETSQRALGSLLGGI